MGLELRLVRDDDILLRLPLSPQGTRLESFDLDDYEIEQLSSLYSMGANQKRLRVMAELAKGKELRFSDVLQIVTNPKLVQDCLQPLLKQGLILHEGRGAGYRLSQRALPLMALVTTGLVKVISVLEEESGGP